LLFTVEKEEINSDAILKRLATEPEDIIVVGMHKKRPLQWEVHRGPNIEDYVLKTLRKLNIINKVLMIALLVAFQQIGVCLLHMSSKVLAS